MKLTRCDRGHYYDVEKFGRCPECGSADDVNTVPEKDTGCSLTQREIIYEDDNNTIRHIPTKNGIEPVVGWLVCVEGEYKGKDFRLKSDINFIGRSPRFDVNLEKDLSVSRDVHIKVVFEPKSGKFLVTPGESKELAYLNGDVVLERRELQAYDTISLGESKLLFVPLCSDKFSWEEKN